MPVPDISRISPFGPKSEYINVIIETPKGSPTKFKYEPEHGLFVFDKTLPIGQSFPFDFGFLPSTKGGDGDPLDVLVLTDEPTFVGCLIHAKVLGILEAEQTENNKTERNDRVIAIPIEAKSLKPAPRAIERLKPSVTREITKFFVEYNRMQGKKFKILRSAGPEGAETLIRAAMSYPKKRARKPSLLSPKSRSRAR
jgi:inorganic pyrophosphatase